MSRFYQLCRHRMGVVSCVIHYCPLHRSCPECLVTTADPVKMLKCRFGIQKTAFVDIHSRSVLPVKLPSVTCKQGKLIGLLIVVNLTEKGISIEDNHISSSFNESCNVVVLL